MFKSCTPVFQGLRMAAIHNSGRGVGGITTKVIVGNYVPIQRTQFFSTYKALWKQNDPTINKDQGLAQQESKNEPKETYGIADELRSDNPKEQGAEGTAGVIEGETVGRRKPAPDNDIGIDDDKSNYSSKKNPTGQDKDYQKVEIDMNKDGGSGKHWSEIGFSAMPNPFIKIFKITAFGVTLLLIVKYFINDKKNSRYRKDSSGEGIGDELNTAQVRPGFPIGPSEVQRKSEYEGAGNSYSSRRSGDKFSR